VTDNKFFIYNHLQFHILLNLDSLVQIEYLITHMLKKNH
jgi:hypothetical protein